MNDLKNTTALVRSILERDKQCRNSDSLLYLRVITTIGNRNGIDIEEMSIPHFFLNLHGAGFPGFETVSRTRQKLQQHHPELAACERVEGFRSEREKEFRAYAVGDV